MDEKKSFTERFGQILVGIGLIAILLLGAWGIIQVALAIPTFVQGGNPFSFITLPSSHSTSTPSTSTVAGESVSVTTPSLATTGEPVTIAWTHTGGSGNYTYLVSYSCVSGVSLKAPVPTGSTQSVDCNTPFNFTDATQNLTVTPTLSGSKQAVVGIAVAAENLSTKQITAVGTTTLTLLPAKSAASGPSSGNSSSYVAPTTPARSLYGLGDLSTTITSEQFINGRYAIQFTIKNIGTNTVPYGWTFSANVPVDASYFYQSQPQQSLAPGAGVVYTLGFTPTTSAYSYSTGGYYPYSNYGTCGYTPTYTYNGIYNYQSTPSWNCGISNPYNNQYYPQNYGGVFTVTADPQGYVSELSKTNNSASVTLH